VLKLPDGSQFPMKIRSMVGLIPLFAVETLEPDVLDRLPDFKRRLEWFVDHRPDLTKNLACMSTEGWRAQIIVHRWPGQLRSILKFMLDEREFLSPYGIRALSQFHRDQPYKLNVHDMEHRVDYEPVNLRPDCLGQLELAWPHWFPVNYLLVESLQKFHHYLGNDFKVEFPRARKDADVVGSGGELSRRMTSIFLQDERGGGRCSESREVPDRPHWRDLVLFHEYFHADSGRASAQPSDRMDGVVTKLIQQSGESHERKKTEPTVATAAAD